MAGLRHPDQGLAAGAAGRRLGGTATLPFFAVDTYPSRPTRGISEIRPSTASSRAPAGCAEARFVARAHLDPRHSEISANVAASTHGESTERGAGHGESVGCHQTFHAEEAAAHLCSVARRAERRPQHVAVRVNGVLWPRCPPVRPGRPRRGLQPAPPDDGQTDVIFGDGTQGCACRPAPRNHATTARDRPPGTGGGGQPDPALDPPARRALGLNGGGGRRRRAGR